MACPTDSGFWARLLRLPPSLSTIGAGAVAGGAAEKRESEAERESERERGAGGGGSHRDPLEEEPRGFCRPACAI